MSDRSDAPSQPIRSVLHPTDLTRLSEPAFVHALRIAQSARSRFYLLHADPKDSEEVDWTTFPAVRQTLARWGLLDAGAAADAVAERLGIEIRKVQMRDKDPVRAILRFLDDHTIDLIVLATHGRDGLPRWLRGSVAEPVARQAYLPTLFIPDGARDFVSADSGEVRLAKVLVPVDRRPRPEHAVQECLRLGQALGSPDLLLHTMHVGDPADVPVLQAGSIGSRRLESSVRSGDAVEQIVAAAAELEVDLIAMATAGHQGFLDALRGSTTERVLRHAPCPVLAVPAS
jgi:nucleotide-binding universal stress UspA family protein